MRQSSLWSQAIGALLLLGSASACQPLDEGAALGEPFTLDERGVGGGLELADGGLPQDACEQTAEQAREILERTCASCHGGASPGARQGSPPFDCVLDTDQLLTMTSATVIDQYTRQPARFLVAGDPDHSRIYVRIANQEMPPPDVVGLPPNPRPSTSDLSVLRHWIEQCVQDPDIWDEDAGVADVQGTTH